MAVLDLVPGLEAIVCVDGLPLEEYSDDGYEEIPTGEVAQHKAIRTVTRYIESTSEKEFAVHISAIKGYTMDCDGIFWNIRIDGKRMASFIFDKDACYDCMSGDRVVTSIKKEILGVSFLTETGQQMLRKFRFSKIELDESKMLSVETDAEHMKEVGEILVEIHEKALKGQAKSHSTTLGQAAPIPKINYMASEKLDGVDKPQARFRFLYRSKKSLKSLLILEGTPTPEPEPIDLTNLSASQRMKVEQFIQGLANGGQRASSTLDTKIKRERSTHWDDKISCKKRKLGEKVTIDLTEDFD